MNRFDDLLSRIFKAGKPSKRMPPEEDAEEIEEGGIPPNEDSKSDE
jgi:hypothetical protein